MPDFTPVSWTPPKAPGLVGPYAANDALDAAEFWPTPGVGPEDVVVDADGSAITGLEDGRIVRVSGSGTTTIADVGGRPLGIEWLSTTELLVCNADLGLQAVTLDGDVASLATGYDGVDFLLTNNATVTADGTIFFTDTSTRWTLGEYVNDMIEGQGTGRLFRRSPGGTIELLLDGLHFANGVAVDAAEDSVFVAETAHYRVSRYWLRGPKKGTSEVFADNLPGFPDNLSIDGEILWVPLASPRQAMVDIMLPRKWMRTMTYKLPESLKPKPVRHGIVLGFNLGGSLVHNFQSATGKVAATTGARHHDGKLYVGTLTELHVAVLDI